MDSQKKATKILEEQLQIAQDEILQSKIEIADTVLRIFNRKTITTISELEDMKSDYNNISRLIKMNCLSEAKMEALLKSKEAIDNCYAEIVA